MSLEENASDGELELAHAPDVALALKTSTILWTELACTDWSDEEKAKFLADPGNRDLVLQFCGHDEIRTAVNQAVFRASRSLNGSDFKPAGFIAGGLERSSQIQ